MVDFTKPSELRERFAELAETRETILAESGPKRQARDLILQEANTKAGVLDAEIKEIETDLFDISQEQALIARALGGRTGE